jgi:hypothetical protein
MPSVRRGMFSLRIVAAVASVATALMAVATANAGGSNLSTTTTTCPVITATPWVAPYVPHPKGNKYDVHVHGKGWTCKRADAYVIKLVANKVQGNFPSIVKGGPTGWYCTASRSKSGLAYTGQCSPTKAASFSLTAPGFSWTVG